MVLGLSQSSSLLSTKISIGFDNALTREVFEALIQTVSSLR